MGSSSSNLSSINLSRGGSSRSSRSRRRSNDLGSTFSVVVAEVELR